MYRALSVAFIASLLVICASVSSAAETERQQDLRLSKTITLSETHALLDDLLKKASEESGVTMRADQETKAWKIRELPVSVEVKDATVQEFQAQLARLLDLRWARSGREGEWVYTIWQDRNSRDREARELQSKQDEQLEKVTAQWQEIADGLKALMSPHDKTSQEQAGGKNDPEQDFGKFVSQDPFGKAYGSLVSALASSAVPSVAAGEPFRVPYNQLTPAQQSSLQFFATGMNYFHSKLGNKTDSTAFDGDWSKTSLVMRPMPSGPGHAVMDQIGFAGTLEVSGVGAGGRMGFPIVTPGSPMAALITKAVNRFAQGEDPRTVVQQIGTEIGEAVQTINRETAARELAETPAPTDPRLLTEVEIDPKDISDAAAALKPVVEKAHIDIYAEAWNQPDRKAAKDKGTAKKVIAGVSSTFGMTWDYSAGAARLKADDWAQRRAAMVAQADKKYWADLAKKNGGLNLEELAQIAQSYSQEQLMGLLMSDQTLSASGWALVTTERRSAVLFYGSLPESQIERLRSTGLSALGLSPQERSSLDAVLIARGISARDFFVPGALVKLLEAPDTGTKLVLSYPPDKTQEIDLTRPVKAPPAPPEQETRGQ
ncbi:MAG: hypothetical protein IT209_08240 [Armatimonadetes bacterium]|nr:hypothetical protein [Armatimonadota bacterium]